jgi:hypothetical protein
MGNGIFLIKDDESLVAMSEKAYDSEALLQELLGRYPDLLAGDQIDPVVPRRWLLVDREAEVPGEEGGGGRWSADHLFLDQDGIPTIVEVKRSSDTRIRREVVGQMLDYAANGVAYWPVEKIQATLEGRCDRAGVAVEDALAALLGTDSTPEGFWQKVKTNLQAGRVRMLFVSDEIPPELKRVVEFLNEQMDPAEVLAIEIKQFSGSGLKTLVPRIFGQTSEAQSRKQAAERETKRWDEQSFMEELEAGAGGDAKQVAGELLEWASKTSDHVWWGKGLIQGSFIPEFRHKGIKHFPLGVWTTGRLEVQFERLRTHPPFEDEALRKELLDKLNRISGLSLPPDAISRRPSIVLSELAKGGRLVELLEVLDWVVGKIRES